MNYSHSVHSSVVSSSLKSLSDVFNCHLCIAEPCPLTIDTFCNVRGIFVFNFDDTFGINWCCNMLLLFPFVVVVVSKHKQQNVSQRIKNITPNKIIIITDYIFS